MAEEKKSMLGREYVIPLRNKTDRVPRYKRANKAVKTIKEFLVRHMKVRDGDLNKIKIDKYLNEEIWHRGIKKPPAKIKVKVTKDEGTGFVNVELAEMPVKLKFKKAREDKREDKAKEILESKKKMMDRIKEQSQKKEEKPSEEQVKESEEKKEEAEEKKSSVVEATQKMEKAQAKTQKHAAPVKSKEPKRPQRKSLAK